MIESKDRFRELIRRLKLSPSLDTSVSKKSFLETWKSFQSSDPEHGDEVTPAIIVAVILFDEEMFGSLLTEAELTQLTASARIALERYQLKTNPPNQPGKRLFAALKELTASGPP